MPEIITIDEAKELYYNFCMTINCIEIIMSLDDKEIALKSTQEFRDSRQQENVFIEPLEQDRIFPADSAIINNFWLNEGKDVPIANIHTGPRANEIARIMNAFAVTMGEDVYFRNDAYNPYNEEGRKLIAHELTHIYQYNKRQERYNITRKELESEAEEAESHDNYIQEPVIAVKIKREYFYFFESQKKKIADGIANRIVEWIDNSRYRMSDQEYLSFLCAVESWLNEES